MVFVLEDGPRTPGNIAVGLPVKRESDCACEVMIGPMDIHTIYGDTTMQALLLATRFLGTRLQHFLSRGGRVVFPPDGFTQEDEDIPLREIFGVLLGPADEDA